MITSAGAEIIGVQVATNLQYPLLSAVMSSARCSAIKGNDRGAGERTQVFYKKYVECQSLNTTASTTVAACVSVGSVVTTYDDCAVVISSDALVNTVNAMLNYGDSAAVYLESTGQYL